MKVVVLIVFAQQQQQQQQQQLQQQQLQQQQQQQQPVECRIDTAQPLADVTKEIAMLFGVGRQWNNYCLRFGETDQLVTDRVSCCCVRC